MLRGIILLLTVLVAPIFPAAAQETSGGFADGSIKIGYDNRTCNSSLAGSIRYNSATACAEYCNGTGWTCPGGFSGPADCPNIGNQCADTTIFAGYHPTLHERLFLHPNSQSTGAAWRSSGAGSDTGAVDFSNGEVNQTWIVANRTIANYPAFKLCNDLNLASALGYSDWYLPSAAELVYLFTVYPTINAGSGDDFLAVEYWSSTEYDSTDGLWGRFSSGRLTNNVKTGAADIRCLRR